MGNVENIHCLATCSIEDTKDTTHEESRTAHKHECQLHGCIFFRTCAPHTNQQIHRDKSYFIEHKHGEHVDGNEETINTCTQQCEPQEVFLIHVPRNKRSCKHDDGGEQQHCNRDSIDSDGVLNVQWCNPIERGGEQHFCRITSSSFLKEEHCEDSGKDEQAGTTRYHHASNTFLISC